MSCRLHRECPTSCRHWAPCLEECDHEACVEAIGFGAWLENQSISGRPHILSADCWCRPAVESFV